MKKKTIIITILITLLSFTAITSYSRYTHTVSRTGTIATADVGYCKNKNISSFSECLIRNDSQQELAAALSTIDTRTSSVNFNNVEPIGSYIPKTTYTNITNKTNTTAINSTTANRFTYVVESKLITEFSSALSSSLIIKSSQLYSPISSLLTACGLNLSWLLLPFSSVCLFK